MEVRIEEDGSGVHIIELSGPLSMDAVPPVKAALSELVDGGARYLLVDCRAMDFISSLGIGALTEIRRRLKQSGGQVRLCAVAPELLAVFDLTRVRELFEIHPDRRSALQAHRAAQSGD